MGLLLVAGAGLLIGGALWLQQAERLGTAGHCCTSSASTPVAVLEIGR